MAMARRLLWMSGFCLLWLWTFNGSWAEDDLECLVTFKSSVRDPRNYLASWMTANASQLCSWVGVNCWNDQDPERKVLWLELAGAGLSGPFPASTLQCFASLTSLNLSGNAFTGTLPLNLPQELPYLTSLDLSHNLLEGSIPPTLSDCIYLNRLHLQGNHLSGEIPWQLGNLPRLTDLDLSSNDLAGVIPSSLTNRSSLHLKPFDESVFANNPHLRRSPARAPFYIRWKVQLLIGASILSALLLLISSVLLAFRWPDKLPLWLKQYFIFAIHGRQSSKLQWQETHLNLKWEEVQNATSFFNPANIIGSGGSSTVYKGRLLDGQEIAVKVLHNEELGLQLQPKQLFSTELHLLSKLRHRNLVKVLGFCCNSETMAIILDYMPAGSLDAVLRHESATSNLAFGWKARLHILLGIAEGLAYLHNEYDGKLSVIHADLKPANVLLDEYMEAHIADFGIATFVNNINNSSVASASKGQVLAMPCWSLGYTAPECVQQGLVSRKGDVFSFGVIVLEMITGECPSSKKLKEGENLVNWVSESLAKGDMERVIGPMLLSVDDMTRWREDLSAILKMGCSCASMAHANRPNMAEVVAFLRRICGKIEDNRSFWTEDLYNSKSPSIVP